MNHLRNIFCHLLIKHISFGQMMNIWQTNYQMFRSIIKNVLVFRLILYFVLKCLCRQKANLKKSTIFIFFNANTECRQIVGKEILPDESGLAMGRWPGVEMHRPTMSLGYERNKKSLAYVAPYKPPYRED